MALIMKLLTIIFILIPSVLMGQPINTISMNNPVNSFSSATVTTSIGTKFALPTQATQCTWQTIYGTAPASITVQLQTSIDGTNFPSTDVSTSTAGEIRTVYTSARQIRAEITASSGGTTITVTINCKNAPIAVVSASGTTTVTSNKFLAGDGTAAAPSYTFANETGLGLYRRSASVLGVMNPAFSTSAALTVFRPTGLVMSGFTSIGWSDGADAGSATNDLFLSRDAANTLALRNGTNTQLFRVGPATTYLEMNSSATDSQIVSTGPTTGLGIYGSGSAGIKLGGAFANQWQVTPAGNLVGLLTTNSIGTGANAVLRAGTPVVTGNGTLVAGGTNTAGKVTSTTTGAATITITFSSAWTNAPACVVTNETTANLARASSTTTVASIVGTTVTGDVLSYNCIGW